MKKNKFLISLILIASKTISAPTMQQSVKIDGILEEEVWSKAAIIENWTQQQPKEGEKGTLEARILIWRDKENLYIGYEAKTDKLINNYKKRDQTLYNDDKIEIVIDPYLSKRNGYYFGINANGSRVDGTITNESRPDQDWDGYWEGMGTLTKDGWSAEIKIPFSTLAYAENDNNWGINFKYWYSKEREAGYWTGWGKSNSLNTLSKAGELTGMNDLPSSNPWIMKPFILGKATQETEMDYKADVGIDIIGTPWKGWRIASVLNADFGEAEADVQQSNLTRYSLFFPEKRDFFLENSGLFSFGSKGSALPFHSRNIGLDKNGNQLPLRVGSKITGKFDINEVGFLTAWVEGSIDEHFAILRTKHQITDNTNIGFISSSEDSNSSNMTNGIDVSWKSINDNGTRLNVDLWSQFSSSENKDGEGHYLKVESFGNPLSASAEYMIFDADFDPGLGYYRYSSLNDSVKVKKIEIEHSENVSKCINFWKKKCEEKYQIREISNEISFNEISNGANKLVENSLRIEPLGLSMNNGWSWRPEITMYKSVLDQDFEPWSLPGTIIPAGEYDYVDYGLNYFGWAYDYKWVWGGGFNSGDWYDASKTSLDGWLNYKITNDFSFGPNWNMNNVKRGSSSSSSEIYSFDFGYTPTSSHLYSLSVQKNNLSDAINAYFRFEFRPKDGEATYLVVNTNDESTGDSWKVIFKKEWLY